MPGIGPSLLFATGLVVGVGAGALWPRKNAAEKVILPPPPPEGNYRGTPSAVMTPTGGAILQGGFPGPIPDVIKRTAYTAAYDRAKRHPAWTAEHLTAASLARTPPPQAKNANPVPLEVARAGDTLPTPAKGDRSKSVFMEDESTPELFRAKLTDWFPQRMPRFPSRPWTRRSTYQTSPLKSETASTDTVLRFDWAYLEDFCRRLTTNFEDVYVFTVPLYLPHRDPDGKWRVTYEVIGTPPSISVPTHFAKVILASRTDFSYPQKPNSKDPTVTSNSTIKELAMGAFILPNAVIPDEADIRSFIAPVEAVEKAAGLQLFNADLKSKSKQLCAVTQCQLIVRRFDDARKQIKKN